MVESPDIGGYDLYSTQIDGQGCTSANTLNTEDEESDDEPPQRAKSYGQPLRKTLSLLYTASHLFALLLLLYLSFTSVPQTSGHVLPSRANTGNIESASLVGTIGGKYIDTALLEKRLSLREHDNEGALLGTSFSPTTIKRAESLFLKRQAPPACTISSEKHEIPAGRKVAFAILVVILVLLSGVFAGLTLGYMSLDETQLQVLMTTGSDVQKARAAKIMPIRKDGHLLLTTLLIANMITNEVCVTSLHHLGSERR